MWYRKIFQVPNHWEGSNVLLHFGAVDWQCKVYVNGKEIGNHTGGYDKVWPSSSSISVVQRVWKDAGDDMPPHSGAKSDFHDVHPEFEIWNDSCTARMSCCRLGCMVPVGLKD